MVLVAKLQVVAGSKTTAVGGVVCPASIVPLANTSTIELPTPTAAVTPTRPSLKEAVLARVRLTSVPMARTSTVVAALTTESAARSTVAFDCWIVTAADTATFLGSTGLSPVLRCTRATIVVELSTRDVTLTLPPVDCTVASAATLTVETTSL